MVFEVKPLFTKLTPSYYLSLSDNIANPPSSPRSPRADNEPVEKIHSLGPFSLKRSSVLSSLKHRLVLASRQIHIYFFIMEFLRNSFICVYIERSICLHPCSMDSGV